MLLENVRHVCIMSTYPFVSTKNSNAAVSGGGMSSISSSDASGYGTSEKVYRYSTVHCSVISPCGGTLRFEYSHDNTNWDFIRTHTVVADTGDNFVEPVLATYFRIGFVPSAGHGTLSTETGFRMGCIFTDDPPHDVNIRFDASDTLSVTQTAHDSLNCNANVQVGNADNSLSNPVFVEGTLGARIIKLNDPGGVTAWNGASVTTTTSSTQIDVSGIRNISIFGTSSAGAGELNVLCSATSGGTFYNTYNVISMPSAADFFGDMEVNMDYIKLNVVPSSSFSDLVVHVTGKN